MKNVFLKRVAIVIIAVVTMSMSAFAQEKGDMAIGGSLVFGSGNGYGNVGLGGKFQYNVTNPIRLEGAFTYFFEKKNTSMWDLSANAHYLFKVADQITVYPLAGVGILGVSSYGHSDSDFGINLGGGLDYKLADNLFINAELKFRVGGDWDRTMFGIGLGYRF